MRFVPAAALRILGLGCLALMLGLSNVLAQNAPPAGNNNGSGRSFGTYNCQQKFSCSDSEQSVTIANACATEGFGISVDFGNASLDNNNCMTAQAGNNSKSSSQCCVIPNGDMCSVRCSLILH